MEVCEVYNEVKNTQRFKDGCFHLKYWNFHHSFHFFPMPQAFSTEHSDRYIVLKEILDHKARC